MCNGQDGRSHKPRQAHDGANSQHDGHHEQVQMVATAFLWGDSHLQSAAWSGPYNTKSKASGSWLVEVQEGGGGCPENSYNPPRQEGTEEKRKS